MPVGGEGVARAPKARSRVGVGIQVEDGRMGVIFLAFVLGMVLGMALLVRWWRKRQADRESALVHALEESRAQTAVATDAAGRTETQRDVSVFSRAAVAYTSGQARPIRPVLSHILFRPYQNFSKNIRGISPHSLHMPALQIVHPPFET